VRFSKNLKEVKIFLLNVVKVDVLVFSLLEVKFLILEASESLDDLVNPISSFRFQEKFRQELNLVHCEGLNSGVSIFVVSNLDEELEDGHNLRFRSLRHGLENKEKLVKRVGLNVSDLVGIRFLFLLSISGSRSKEFRDILRVPEVSEVSDISLNGIFFELLRKVLEENLVFLI